MDSNSLQLKRLEELKKYARFLDSQYELPWGIRIGWDSILTWIPGIGDLITNVLAFYIIYQGIRLGCSPSVVLRMGLNLLIDNVIDVFPALGNILDIFWKANNRNVALIEAYLKRPQQTLTASRFVMGLTVVILLVSIIIILVLIFIGVAALIRLLSAGF